MTRGGLRLGRLAGIPIAIQPLWIVIVALMTWSLGAAYFPDRVSGISDTAAYLLGLASALLLFAGILAHELGHAVVARNRGIEVQEIDLWLLGGVARITGEPRRPGDELRFAAAGPAITALLIAVWGGLYALVGNRDTAPSALVEYQLIVNALILGFNLLPAFPLDGGRLLRAALWRGSGDRLRATAQAAALGRAFAVVLGTLGLLSALAGGVGGLWLVAVAVFLFVAGGAEAQGMRVEEALGGLTAGDVAVPPVCVVASASAAEAVDLFAHHLYTAFPVVEEDGGRALGLLTIDRVRLVAPPDRPWHTVAELADRDPDLLVPAATPIAEVLRRPAFQRVGRAVVVDALGAATGLLSLTDVQRRVRAHELERAPQALPGAPAAR